MRALYLPIFKVEFKKANVNKTLSFCENQFSPEKFYSNL